MDTEMPRSYMPVGVHSLKSVSCKCPGVFAKIDLGLKNIEGALLVPTQCIIPEARNKKLIVVKNGKAEFRKVETGIRNESYIQITNGVETGDTIVATALMYVKPDAGVKVVKVIE